MRKKLIVILGIMLGLSIVACKTNENANVSSEGIEITADSEIVADEEFEKEIAEKNANALEGQAIIDKYMNGEISEEDFLKMYGDYTVFYTLPYGTDDDGNNQLFILTNPEGESFWTAFTTPESMDMFYQKANRSNFFIMYGDFKELLEVLDETNEQNPIMKSGVVINPDTDGIMISSSELKSVLGLYNE